MTDLSTSQQVTWIYCQDLDATCAFYADILQLPLRLDQGLCRIYQTSPSSFLGVCVARPGRHMEPKGVVYTFVAPNRAGVDAWHHQLENAAMDAAGAKLEGPPEYSERFNVYAFFALDPNGYRLEFQTFLDPAWRNALDASSGLFGSTSWI